MEIQGRREETGSMVKENNSGNGERGEGFWHMHSAKKIALVSNHKKTRRFHLNIWILVFPSILRSIGNLGLLFLRGEN